MWNKCINADIIKLLFLLIGDFFLTRIRSGKKRKRTKCDSSLLIVGIHEWGGYELSREKNIRLIKPFTCGLQYQLERFSEYKGKREVHVIVTMSDMHLHKNVGLVKDRCEKLIETSNLGMDFAGYTAIYNRIKDEDNKYVLLSNSSVNSVKHDFIDDYLDYMDQNPDVGILGISYNSKCYQSLIKDNFMPHLQSFFLLTTIEVLRQIVEYNKGVFPGSGISNKQLLIREGEIKISQIALALGYSLAVTQEDGVHKFDNEKSKWNLKKGDSRINCEYPNMIWPLK